MLTPQDITNRSFPKAVVGGYNMAMVDEFLDEVTDDYTALYKENAALKAKMKILVDKVEEYRETEDSMRAALLTAQKMASTMVADAEAQKASLLATAETEAKERVRELEEQLDFERRKLNAAKSATADFLSKTRAICEQQMRVLDKLPELTIEQVAAREKTDESAAADVSAIGEKILASFGTDKAAETEPAAEPEETAPVEPEREPESAEEEPFAEEPTRKLKFSDLKFGRNYNGNE